MQSTPSCFEEKFKRIEQYQFLELLGKGANGLVYKGLNAHDGSFVAIKQMIIGKSQMRAIKTELTFLKKLEHPAIVKYIDAIQKDNRIYLILEFIEGGSLAALGKKFRLDEQVIKIYIKQVLVGLGFLHNENVIHRDIKGANILITKHGKVKLADFGVAVKIQQSQKTISAAGSPYWIAPQIIIGESQPSTKCDIWSLGCTIVQLLTGNPPYFQLMQFPALFRIVEDNHPPLPECSEYCRQFLLKCFIKDPIKRPTSAELLSHRWLAASQKGQKHFEMISQQDEQLQCQISESLNPFVNYQKILSLLENNQNRSKIYRHYFFHNFIENKHIPLSSQYEIQKGMLQPFPHHHHKQRIRIILKMIENNTDGLCYLEMLGVISGEVSWIMKYLQENKLFMEKSLPLSSSHTKQINTIIDASSLIIRETIKLFVKCQQYSRNLTHQSGQKNTPNIIPIIIKYALPLTGKIFDFYGGNQQHAITIEERLVKIRLLQCLEELLVVVMHDNSSAMQPRSVSHNPLTQKINFCHLCQVLGTSGIFQEIFNLNEQNLISNLTENLSIFLLKMELQLKLMSPIILLAQNKPKYQVILKYSVRKLMKHGLKPPYCSQLSNQTESEKIKIGRLLLINQVAKSNVGRGELQQRGIIYHICQEIIQVSSNISELSENCYQQLLIIAQICEKMIEEQCQIQQNRKIQFQRHLKFKTLNKLINQLEDSSLKIKSKKRLVERLTKIDMALYN